MENDKIDREILFPGKEKKGKKGFFSILIELTKIIFIIRTDSIIITTDSSILFILLEDVIRKEGEVSVSVMWERMEEEGGKRDRGRK